jgi:heptosyltransferase II
VIDPKTQPATNGPILILQPLPGVGDLVWHLPVMHAIAAAHPEHERILLTKHRSRAEEMLIADPAIDRVIWVDRAEQHSGPGGFLALVRDLRIEGFSRSYQLHHSARYAAAIKLAGIRERFAYGTTAMTRWLTMQPHLGNLKRSAHPIDLAREFVDLLGFEMPEHADRLRVAPEHANNIQQQFSGCPRPWIAIGLGSSEPFKQWGADRFASLIKQLADAGPASFFLLGGPGEADFLPVIKDAVGDHPHAVLIPTFDWKMSRVVAAQAGCDCYVGNDTAFVNISAAVGVPALGLFGATEPLRYSPYLDPVLPGQGQISRQDGMVRIQPAEVVPRVLATLSKRAKNHHC